MQIANLKKGKYKSYKKLQIQELYLYGLKAAGQEKRRHSDNCTCQTVSHIMSTPAQLISSWDPFEGQKVVLKVLLNWGAIFNF